MAIQMISSGVLGTPALFKAVCWLMLLRVTMEMELWVMEQLRVGGVKYE
jgi:hypothetical protein